MSKKYWESYFNAIKNQNWEEAKNSLENLCNYEKGNPQVHLKLGDIYQRMGEHIHAINSYHKSAWILKKQGFIQKALALYKIILRLDSYNAEAINRSKELMMELESSKMQASIIPPFETKFEEKAEQKVEAEVRPPLEIEEEAEQKIEAETSVRMEDFIERTSYDEESLVTSPSLEMHEQEEIEIQQKTEIPEINQDEESTSYLSSLFSSLPEDERKQLIDRAESRLFSSGQTVIEEGDFGDSIFFLKSGHARVIAHILGKEIELATLSAGDVFGEVAFITGRPRTASVVAIDNLKVIELNRVLLEDILERYPDILEKLHDFYQCRVQDTLQKVRTEIKKKGT
jgi:CRP-like cAMP-binding protein